MGKIRPQTGEPLIKIWKPNLIWNLFIIIIIGFVLFKLLEYPIQYY